MVAMPPIATEVTAYSVVCPSVTPMHPAVELNEIPFGRDIRVTLTAVVLTLMRSLTLRLGTGNTMDFNIPNGYENAKTFVRQPHRRLISQHSLSCCVLL